MVEKQSEITVTITDEEMETVIGSLHNRARVIGNATRDDRTTQERLYRLSAKLDQQARPINPPGETQCNTNKR